MHQKPRGWRQVQRIVGPLAWKADDTFGLFYQISFQQEAEDLNNNYTDGTFFSRFSLLLISSSFEGILPGLMSRGSSAIRFNSSA